MHGPLNVTVFFFPPSKCVNIKFFWSNSDNVKYLKYLQLASVCQAYQ